VIVSFRAECPADLKAFQDELEKRSIEFSWQSNGEDGLPDVEVEMDVFEADIKDVFDAARSVVDGHVICDTLRTVPLSDNSLERRYMAKNDVPSDWT
jgi:hypothetical protein